MARDVIPTIDDPQALKALAHPLRLDLLEAIGVHGPLTATGAAEIVGESPANCSWHLRQLARYGFLEEVPGPGRQRPWRRTSTGMQWHDSGEDTALDAASRALTRVFIDREVARIKEAISTPQPEGWGDSVVAVQSITWLTAEELARLDQDVMALLAPFRDRLADPATRPEGARPVRVIALAAADDSLAVEPPDPASDPDPDPDLDPDLDPDTAPDPTEGGDHA